MLILAARLFLSVLAFGECAALAADSSPTKPLAWPVPDWQTSPPDKVQMSEAGLEAVRKWHEQSGTRAALVIRHGRIVGEWYFAGARANEPLLAFSVTKSVSSTAVGMAIAKGKLSLTTPLGKFLPELAPAEKKTIAVGQLLSMTSGVYNNHKLDRVGDPFRYAMLEAPLDFHPGEKWDYNNTGLALLSPCFERATGQRLDEFVAARIFKPIGIRPVDWTWDEAGGLPLPYSGLHITARGLGRFGLLVLRRGRWKDRQIVPADWLARATRPSQDLEKNYGYLWWNNAQGKWRGTPSDAFAAIGKFENDLLIVPSLDLIVVRL
ncbi:MAG TPA: serine hydrolase, partial [Pirellulales bacterium]|nr:serine hydrolase [Pirellulales bacterium]